MRRERGAHRRTVSGGVDRIPMRREEASGQLADTGIVVDDQEAVFGVHRFGHV